jgi:hypothetical protein
LVLSVVAGVAGVGVKDPDVTSLFLSRLVDVDVDFEKLVKGPRWVFFRAGEMRVNNVLK